RRRSPDRDGLHGGGARGAGGHHGARRRVRARLGSRIPEPSPRPLALKPFVLAIDGPAGAGKSTTARGVAQRLGLLHVDSGSMYRAVAWAANRKGVSLDDEKALLELLETRKIVPGPEGVCVDGASVECQIRTAEAGEAVPPATTAIAPEEHVSHATHWATLAMTPVSRPGLVYSFGAGFTRLFARSLLDFHLEGLDRIPRRGPLIVACNHITFWDPPLV